MIQKRFTRPRKRGNSNFRWFVSRVSNGVLEAINGLLKAAEGRARGYRATRNLIAMLYLIAGKLNSRLSPI